MSGIRLTMAVNHSLSFGQLLAAARNGSDEALGELLDRYRGYLLAIANDEVGSNLVAKVAASDVVQETFLATHRAFGNFRGTSESELKVWLRRVLLNQVNDSARAYVGSSKRDVSREWTANENPSSDGCSPLAGVPGADPTPSASAIRLEQITAVKQALANLPTEQCEIVIRRSIKQESFKSIGESLQRSPDSVRMIWRRTIDKLIDQMAIENV